MPNILDSIQISGSSYDIKDKNAPSVSAVTQQEYDNLPSSAKTSNTFFVITDATPVDVSQYWTSAQTQSAINQATSGKADTSAVAEDIAAAVSGKVDTSAITSSVTSASTDSEIPTAKAVFDAIPTGGTGGGKAISAGTNISVTTGETADTINCTLPITISDSANGSKQSIAIGSGSSAHISNWFDSIAIGKNSKGYFGSVVIGSNPTAYTTGNGGNVAIGNETKFYNNSIIIGNYAQGYNGYNANSVAIGVRARANNIQGAVAIGCDVYTDGTTKTNINNQIKIDSSNQVYISNSANTSTYCVQEKIEATEAALGGLSLVKLTQAEYDALVTKDSNTLYVIVN